MHVPVLFLAPQHVIEHLRFSQRPLQLAGLSAPADAVRCRLFMLVPTEQEVKALLDHVDSPYIRAVRARRCAPSCEVELYCYLASGLCQVFCN